MINLCHSFPEPHFARNKMSVSHFESVSDFRLTFLFSGEVWLFFFSAPSSSACRGSLLPDAALAGKDSWLLAFHPVRSTPAAHHS